MKSLKNIYKKETKLIEDHGVPMNYNDYEGRMAKQNLFNLHKYSKELFEMIHDYQEMESWVQEKIAKAADYIGSVKHYLEYEMEHPEDKNAFDSDEYYEHVQHIDDIIPELKRSIKEQRSTKLLLQDNTEVIADKETAYRIVTTFMSLNEHQKRIFSEKLIESRTSFWSMVNFSDIRK